MNDNFCGWNAEMARMIWWAVILISLLLASSKGYAQNVVNGTLTITPGGIGHDYVNACAIPTLVAESAPANTCFWSVDASGNLWFAGNNATYGASNQPTQSFVRLYGSVSGTAPNFTDFTPPYYQFLSGTGDVMATLFPSIKTPGVLCVGLAVPGSVDCAGTGAQLVTQSQFGSGGNSSPSPATYWRSGLVGSTAALSAANEELLWALFLPPEGVAAGHLVLDVSTPDASGLYSFAVYPGCSGSEIATSTPQSFPSMGVVSVAFSATLPGGLNCLGITGNSTALRFWEATGQLSVLANFNGGATANGISLASISLPTLSWNDDTVPDIAFGP